jgi:hypothetical protein
MDFFGLFRLCVDSAVQENRLEDNASLRNILQGAAAIGAEEFLAPSACSLSALGPILAGGELGMFYPAGGLAAIRSALIQTIQHSGGVVRAQVPIKEITIEKGVATGVEILIRGEEIILDARSSIISGVGALRTFTKLVQPQFASAAVKTALSTYTEARPKIRVVFWLDGTVEDCQLSSADFTDIGHTDSGGLADKQPYIQRLCRVWSPSAKDPAWASHSPNNQVVIVELEASSSLVELKEFSFATEAGADDGAGSSQENTLLAQIQASDDTTPRGPKLYSPKRSQVAEDTIILTQENINVISSHSLAILQSVYPVAAGRIVVSEVVPPSIGGYVPSLTSAKFSVPLLGATTEIKVSECVTDIPEMRWSRSSSWLAVPFSS